MIAVVVQETVMIYEAVVVHHGTVMFHERVVHETVDAKTVKASKTDLLSTSIRIETGTTYMRST